MCLKKILLWIPDFSGSDVFTSLLYKLMTSYGRKKKERKKEQFKRKGSETYTDTR